jgi:urease accessory protein
MRSRIEIVAEYRSGARPGEGRTVVTAIRGGHHFAGRETGPGVVHLVGTAAGPLGGDDVEIDVRVGPGARLAVRTPGCAPA